MLQVRRTKTTKNRKSPGKNGKAKRTTVEVVYLVCSLPMEQAQPEQVAAWVQNATQTQLENGTATTNDYLIAVNAEAQARQNLILHEIQLIMYQYNAKTTTGN